MSDRSTTRTGSTLGNPPEWPVRLWESWWQMFGLHAPLSGNVRQAIDTAVVRAVGSQLGFINISERASGDPDLERRIVENVASYGRQLSQLLDAVGVLIRHRNGEPLDDRDQAALDRLVELREQIAGEKRRTRRERVDRLERELERFRDDPHTEPVDLARLRRALEQQPRSRKSGGPESAGG